VEAPQSAAGRAGASAAIAHKAKNLSLGRSQTRHDVALLQFLSEVTRFSEREGYWLVGG
jgi:hypothetical protein